MEPPQQTWFDRHPLVSSSLIGGALLGLVQAAVLGYTNDDFPGSSAVFALGGMLFGFISLLLCLPIVYLLRRLLGSWRDPRQASWSAAMAVVVGLSVWFLGQRTELSGWAIALMCALAIAPVWFWPVPKSLRWRSWMSLSLLFLNLTLIGFAVAEQEEGPVETAKRGRARPGAPDVVLITVDTLRADRVGLYAPGTTSLTPQIDRFGNEGVVFERALASSPWTIPSMASIFTGLPALSHGAGSPSGGGWTFLREGLDLKHTTLAERFKEAGYDTRAAVANIFLSRGLGMAQGFDQYVNLWEQMSAAGLLYELPLTWLVAQHPAVQKWGDCRARNITDLSIEWLNEPHETPLFLWAHYIDPHMPYQADPDLYDPYGLTLHRLLAAPKPLEDGTIVSENFVAVHDVRSGLIWLTPEDRERLMDYYGRAVNYVDEHTGRLFEALRAHSKERPLVVIFTSDHGEEFWDHGDFEHGHDYYREITRVPLIVWGNNIPKQRVSALAGLVDVSPTLLELAGIPVAAEKGPPAFDEGRSLVPLWTSPGRPSAESPARILSAGNNLYGLPAVLVEEGPWRFILRANGSRELYDANLDPAERTNLAHQHPDLVERFSALMQPNLDSFLKGKDGEAPELSPEELRALQSLGYVR